MKAFLLAAGFGKRLLPLTETTPKALIEVAGVSLIERHIKRLKLAGIDEFIVNTHWLADRLHQALDDGSKLGVQIRWSHEENILETGGGIKKALPLLGDSPFILVSADIWTDFDFAELVSRPLESQRVARLVLVDNPEHNPMGDFGLQEVSSGAAIAMPCEGSRTYTYSGIAMLDPAWVESWEYGTSAYPLRDPLIKAIGNSQISGLMHPGIWSDVGSPERLQAIRERVGLE